VSSLGLPASGFGIEATVDGSGNTDLGRSMSIVSDVLTIREQPIEFLGDTTRKGSIILQTSVDNELIVLVDNDELATIRLPKHDVLRGLLE
jgi:hypothetical protein